MSDSGWPLVDGSPPGSPVPGILQARILEWIAISFSTQVKQLTSKDYLSSNADGGLVAKSYLTLCNPVDCSPLGSSVGEGNGTPLQYSCLENPMDGGAWWAAVHGSLRVRQN